MNRFALFVLVLAVFAAVASADEPTITREQVSPSRVRVVLEYDGDLDSDLPPLWTIPGAEKHAHPDLLTLRVVGDTEAYLEAAEAAIRAEAARTGAWVRTRPEELRHRLGSLLQAAYARAQAALAEEQARKLQSLSPEQVKALLESAQ